MRIPQVLAESASTSGIRMTLRNPHADSSRGISTIELFRLIKIFSISWLFLFQLRLFHYMGNFLRADPACKCGFRICMRIPHGRAESACGFRMRIPHLRVPHAYSACINEPKVKIRKKFFSVWGLKRGAALRGAAAIFENSLKL